MKNYVFWVVAIFILFAGVSSFTADSQANAVSLSIRSEREFYQLGELVNLEFEVKNNSENKVTILNSLRSDEGYLNVYISKDGKNFEKYNHSKWGVGEREAVIVLNPNHSTINTASVFWNVKPRASDLIATEVVKRASEGKILTDYAFPTSGIYYVKAAYSIRLANQPEAIKIESEPIKITIEEPAGENLEVWNKIKDNGNIAYFIQEGDLLIPSYKAEVREKLRREIEQIIVQYPNSLYARSLQQSLEKFNLVEEKRKAYVKKLSQQKQSHQ